MLHQLSEDGRAFLPQEQLTQTSSIEKWFSRSLLGGNKAIFWHFTVGQWTFVALLFAVNTHTHEPNLVCVHFYYFFEAASVTIYFSSVHVHTLVIISYAHNLRL